MLVTIIACVLDCIFFNYSKSFQLMTGKSEDAKTMDLRQQQQRQQPQQQRTSASELLNYNKQQVNSMSRAEFDAIFSKWEKYLSKQIEYVPNPIAQQEETPAVYIPTPNTAGPKPLTIEEYKARQQARKPAPKILLPKVRRLRGGNAVKIRQEKAKLHRIIHITTDKELKQRLIGKLKALKY